MRELKLPDVLILAEIYAAREQNDIGISSNDLARRIPGAIYCPTLDKVTEALRAGTPIDKIFIARGETDKTLGHIASTARAAGVVVVEADRRKLDAMSQTHAHQGVIALCAVKEYSTIEDMLAIAAERGEAPFLVLCLSLIHI